MSTFPVAPRGRSSSDSSNSHTAEQLRNRTRELLSAFKVPTVWLLLESDDDVPRGATGKVDIQRLREMLMKANRSGERA